MKDSCHNCPAVQNLHWWELTQQHSDLHSAHLGVCSLCASQEAILTNLDKVADRRPQWKTGKPVGTVDSGRADIWRYIYHKLGIKLHYKFLSVHPNLSHLLEVKLDTMHFAHVVDKVMHSCAHLFQFSLRFCLHLPDVIHSQVHPLVNGAEELTVEVGEDPLLLLRRHKTGFQLWKIHLGRDCKLQYANQVGTWAQYAFNFLTG